MMAPTVEQGGPDRNLDPAVLPRRQPLADLTGLADLGQHALTQTEIDRTAIVRIDHVEVPQIAALIDIGNARRDQRENGLADAVQNAKARDPLLERDEIVEERIWPIDLQP